ncbi:MAG: DUF1573 domain-containing protein [Planctomycetaceae bacterium]|nr:DUF1573 domain-containing protein [Planctomycetaceae bacterium]
MKTSGIIVTVLLGALALGLTVWIGRYNAKAEVLIPQTTPTVVADPGPEVSKTGPHPKAVAESTEHDFGTMTLGQESSHKFVVKNEGQADLRMIARKEDASCQCTLGELGDGDSIPPGESREVTLKWKIKAPVQTFRHSAKIRTNDPENRIIEFVVSGKVDQRYTVTPGQTWEVGDLSRTQPTTVKGTIFSTTIEKFAIISSKASNDKIAVAYEPMSAEALTDKEAKSGYDVTATITPGAPIGPYAEKITLITDDIDEHKELVINLQGHLTGPIEFLGPAYHKESNLVTMGEFKADDGKEVTLSLFVRDFDEELQLLGVSPESDRVHFELKKDEKLTGKTRRYQLKVKVLPGPQLDLISSPSLKFELKFNHPEAASVVMRVRMLAI